VNDSQDACQITKLTAVQ